MAWTDGALRGSASRHSQEMSQILRDASHPRLRLVGPSFVDPDVRATVGLPICVALFWRFHGQNRRLLDTSRLGSN
eukprot:6493302-Prymnesium_polylepis.1